MKIKRNVLCSYWCETDYCRGGLYEPPSCVHTRHNPGARCALLLTDYPGTGPERLVRLQSSRPAVCTHATTRGPAVLSSSLTIQVRDQRDYRAAAQLCTHPPQPGGALRSPPH